MLLQFCCNNTVYCNKYAGKIRIKKHQVRVGITWCYSTLQPTRASRTKRHRYIDIRTVRICLKKEEYLIFVIRGPPEKSGSVYPRKSTHGVKGVSMHISILALKWRVENFKATDMHPNTTFLYKMCVKMGV